jgi:hypothetical protein
MRSPPPRRSPALPLLVSAGAHVLLLAALAFVPAPRDEPPDFQGTEVRDGLTLGLDALPEQRPDILAPAESEEPPPIPVTLVNPPTVNPPAPEGDPLCPAPGAGGIIPSSPGPAAPSPLAGQGGGALLAVPAAARSVVYLLDHSTSMGLDGALAVGRREVLASLKSLRPGTFFQVIPYNRQAAPLVLGGRAGLVPLDPACIQQAEQILLSLAPSGSTDHVRALQCGLRLLPDILFLVTDADDMTLQDVATVTACNKRRTQIHAVDLTSRRPRPDSPLQRLAADNGGTCRRVAPFE